MAAQCSTGKIFSSLIGPDTLFISMGSVLANMADTTSPRLGSVLANSAGLYIY